MSFLFNPEESIGEFTIDPAPANEEKRLKLITLSNAEECYICSGIAKTAVVYPEGSVPICRDCIAMHLDEENC